jgi:YD repeat-containing protein
MKSIFAIFSLIVFSCASAHAEDIWFDLNPQDFPVSPSDTHYATADAACRKAYSDDASTFGGNGATVLSYKHPVLVPNQPSLIAYECDTSVVIGGSESGVPNLIYLEGDTCPNGEVLNLDAGQCEALDAFQARRQLGNPNNQPNNDPNDCEGNPINGAIGNKFQSDVDFTDADGELRFAHFYNGYDGLWRHTYGSSLAVSTASLSLTFEDGRVSLFTLSNGIATAEPTELGSLSKVLGSWVYTSPTNEQMTFDFNGRLSKWKMANGQVQTISYGFDSNFNPITTVTDSRGHTLSFSEDASHQPLSLTASGVTVTYNYSNAELTSITRAMTGKTTTRSYVYEDTRNSTWLTGIIDERGVRYATWHYDDQGRATSSEHAGGAEKVTLVYNTDGSTVVTNALGNAVTYQYQLVNGAMRMSAVNGSPAVGCPASNSSYTYESAHGQIATHTDALGHITAFTYDAQGRVITEVDAQGTDQERTTATTYNGATFLPATVTTPDRTITYSYDAQGHLLSTTAHANNQE